MLEKQQLPSEATIFLSSPNEARFRSNASVLMDFSASLFRISAHSVVAHLNKKTAFVSVGKLLVIDRLCHNNLFQKLYLWDFALHWRSRQSKRLSPLRSWVRFSLRTHVKRVRQRSVESRGFSPGAPVSSHRES